MTPKRRQQALKSQSKQVIDGDSHKSSVSQLSPATPLYHNDFNGTKSQPPRSTQVAGTVIVQGTKTPAAAKHSAKSGQRSTQGASAQLYNMRDASVLEGMLKQNQNIGDGLGVIGVTPAMISNNIY